MDNVIGGLNLHVYRKYKDIPLPIYIYFFGTFTIQWRIRIQVQWVMEAFSFKSSWN